MRSSDLIGIPRGMEPPVALRDDERLTWFERAANMYAIAAAHERLAIGDDWQAAALIRGAIAAGAFSVLCVAAGEVTDGWLRDVSHTEPTWRRHQAGLHTPPGDRQPGSNVDQWVLTSHPDTLGTTLGRLSDFIVISSQAVTPEILAYAMRALSKWPRRMGAHADPRGGGHA